MIFINLEHGVSNKSRNRSRNVGSSNEGHDGNHGQTSVVQFTALLDLHLLWVRGSKVDWGEDNGGKVSSLCVVSSSVFGYNLSKENGEVDLSLA